MGVIGVGYEGQTVEELIASLQAEGVATLVDVRLTPLSRKKGLSKTALSARLAEAGIAYVHLRALGNPKENRDAYRQGDAAAVALYESVLASEEGRAALETIAGLAEQGTVALLCFERDQETCHRRQVLAALGQLGLDADLDARRSSGT